MDRYLPLKANATAISVLVIDTDVDTSHLLENALLRIRAGAGLLEALASNSLQPETMADLYRLILSAYLPIQDGLDLLEQLRPQP
ncbi:hypothetical protein [Pseudomonas koreensis]|uniref:Uncharacterized protein n=1 Tax=Pseudomonas koreensis TaxID=198620 RepID=A0A9X2XE74_9PSED|nr:hypothetical protein [Pseudomonas koreensis]MCU7247266.1 hypothetical protein [Pseudomonas koreensis]